MAHPRRTGTSMSVEASSQYKKRIARRRRAEEAAWRARNGPVITRKMDAEPITRSQANGSLGS